MHSLKMSTHSCNQKNNEEGSDFNSKLLTQNLKIIIENQDVSDEQIESMEDDESNVKNVQDSVSDVSEEECGLEVEVAENEIEFHVNLNKVPSTLQNTVLSEKIYLNESLKLEPNPPENLNEISQENLNALYESLGITEDSFAKESTSIDTSNFLLIKDNLFDKKKLHLYGTDELSTDDVFEYFKDYKPIAVEWINDSSCNVIWKNEIHAANALIGMSIPDTDEEDEKKMESDDLEKKPKIINLKQGRNKSRKPPQGSKWRKGVKSVKGYQIYMRYMRQTDRKQKGAESRSEYYRKYGNPNYGNIKGLISQSKRERMKTQQINDAVSDLSFDTKASDESPDDRSRRNLISYELDDYNQSNLEEFGTDNSLVEIESTKYEKLKTTNPREKKLRLYSDDLVEGEDESKKMRSDRLTVKRKSRYKPYEVSSKSRRTETNRNDKDDHNERHNRSQKDPNDLRNKLNGLRSHH